jgi:hypothetical protein
MSHYVSNTVTGLLISLISAVFLLSACSGETDSPEQQIRTLIGQAESAAENKKLDELKQLIADDYRDSQGNDSKNVNRLLLFYFLRHQSIYLLTRIHSIALTDDDQTGNPAGDYANISLSVAMAGTPFPENLSNFRADFFHFNIVMAKVDGSDWKVTQADWRRSDLKDFL